jgi:hypothetical protein
MLQSLLVPGDGPSETGFAIDIKNAFNCIDRGHVLKAFFDRPELSTAWRMMHFSYSQHAKLWLRAQNGSILAALPSSQGVRQGDPLGSLAFAVALHPLLLGTLDQHPVTIVAIHDDATFAGAPEALVHAVRHFRGLARNINLEFNLSKCRLLALHDDPLPSCIPDLLQAFGDEPVQTERNCHTLLGVPIGVRGVEDNVKSIIEAMRPELNAIASATLSKQVRFAMLRLCSQTRPTYLARTLAPHLTARRSAFSITMFSAPRGRSRTYRASPPTTPEKRRTTQPPAILTPS